MCAKTEKHETILGISDAIFPARHPRKSSQHVHACAAGDSAICSKNREIVPYHWANSNTRNGARLRSPSQIMAPVTNLINRKPHRKVTKLKSKFLLILGYLKAMLHEAIFLATCNATITNKNPFKLQRGCYTQATCLATLRKVEGRSTFLATRNATIAVAK